MSTDTELQFDYNYIYSIAQEASFGYSVSTLDDISIHEDAVFSYYVVTNIELFTGQSFWLAGTTYNDSSKTNIVGSSYNGSNLILNSGGQYWVSSAIDLSLYDLKNIVSLVDRSYVPQGASINLYIGTGATKVLAEGSTLVPLASYDFDLYGGGWIVLAIEYIPGGP